jgi:hypothetical protein
MILMDLEPDEFDIGTVPVNEIGTLFFADFFQSPNGQNRAKSGIKSFWDTQS